MTNDKRGRGIESKLNTLRDYRRARGLCIHCGDKWSRGHKCSETVQLHVLQEFWDICHSNDGSGSASVQDDDVPQCVAISMAASGNARSAHAIQFMGTMQGHQAWILVDSGSTHTFVKSVSGLSVI